MYVMAAVSLLRVIHLHVCFECKEKFIAYVLHSFPSGNEVYFSNSRDSEFIFIGMYYFLHVNFVLN